MAQVIVEVFLPHPARPGAARVHAGRLLGSFGVWPAALLGHSVGEYAAACLAGEPGLSDTLRLVAERGALMRRAPEGGMVVVLAAPAVVRGELAGADGLDIAVVKTPRAIAAHVIGG
ncbi:acyltransferase domain-containing protein [Kitasatospora purpeofusca]|uniref:acyltransferase domain-containing protein n=1 Tax=Kitasatospora purpeofusca TaxID=67352 RepID=UPI0035DFF527